MFHCENAKGGTAKVSIANVNQSNGVIHVIDKVRMPEPSPLTGRGSARAIAPADSHVFTTLQR